MAKYIQLNPFQEIKESLETFLEAQYPAIVALMQRPYQGVATSLLREMNLTKEVLVEDHYAGIININILNEKYAMTNVKTTRTPRFPDIQDSAHEVNPEWFESKFLDERDIFKFQLSFKQYRTDNLAIHDVVYSTRYKIIPSDSNPWAAAVLTREDTALLWNDPGMVIGTKKFWSFAEPVLNAWVPSLADVTTQTVFIG